MHKVIHFSQKVYLKSYIHMYTKLRTGANMILRNTFGKTMENVTKHRDIKLLATNKTTN